MTIFTFVIDPTGEEIKVTAATEKEAHRKAWESMTDEQKNSCACLDCVDEIPA